jgi:AAA+ ATPase superfamily predicted ATPase
VQKPAHVFDRIEEWDALDAFIESPRPGASLGLVYGRRRQGKTYLLETIAQEAGGLYFAALDQSAPQNLARLGQAYEAFIGSPAPIRFGTWEEGFRALLALGDGATRPVPVLVDEFSYLIEGAPELPSIVQSLLSPRGAAATSWRTRLVLCGSALSTMRGLLSASAPLRGRAALELMVHPFGYREAAKFWSVQDDPDVAVRLHALVGGTAAYLDMCGGAGPRSSRGFDQWVVRTLLNPASAMFREGSVVVAEEQSVIDTSLYYAVLGAISHGRTRRGEIAAATGRATGALAHPLDVLVRSGMVVPQIDAVRQRRTSYQIAEPILRLHQLVIAPHEPRLSLHQGAAVWHEVSDTVSAKIYGPHFEHLARRWCMQHADIHTLGGRPTIVAPTEVACPEHGTNHEVDVVAVEANPNATDRVIALGEVKWRRSPCDLSHLHRVEHLRSLLRGAEDAKLLLFSRRGFNDDLRATADARSDIELVDLDRLYTGS